MSNERSGEKRDPTIGQALIPIVVLVVLLASSVYLFGDQSSSGPNQIALILSASVGIVIGLFNGYRWKELEHGIVHGISLATSAILILLLVGSLIGTWIMAGVVPTMIYFGISIMAPSAFYVSACVISTFVALATGSSWTTAGTIGIALIGVGTAQDLNLGLVAGAVISGSYFGDKMSPLSDTTNLAPAVSGTNLFVHIRHMIWTTGPSLILALGLFTVAGIFARPPQNTTQLDTILQTLQNHFDIGLHLLIPVVLVLVLIIRKVPAFPALLLGTLTGSMFAIFFQQNTVLTYVDNPDLPKIIALVQGCWTALYSGFELHSGNTILDNLLSRGGMASMLVTVWLIISAMMFGAVMETTGMLNKIGLTILGLVKSSGSLISATLLTSIGMNIIASDQYIAIVFPGRMFRAEYQRRQLDPKNLSRSLEDAGTLTSVLVPWNTCGMFMSQTLGIATLTYAPYCFFNLLNPLIAAIYGFTDFTIDRLPESPTKNNAAKSS